MTEFEHVYDDVFHHIKESAGMPIFFRDLKVDQQIFFRDLFEQIEYVRENNGKETLEDLVLIKSDLEAVIAKFEN